jgi:hypothetical protein
MSTDFWQRCQSILEGGGGEWPSTNDVKTAENSYAKE